MSDSERVSAPSLFSMTPEDAVMFLIWYDAHHARGVCASPRCADLVKRVETWLERARR